MKHVKDNFLNSTSKTRNESTIIIPKIDKRISDKSSYLNAIGSFNSLPNELKILNMDKKA